MKRFIFLALTLLFTWTSDAGILGYYGGPSLSCQSYISATGTIDDITVCKTTSAYYAGQGQWSPASGTVSICQVSMTLTKAAGSVTGYTYYAKIWSMSGTSLDTVLGTSAGITGSDEWSDTNVDFTFTSSVSCTAGTDYAITVDHGAVADGVNYILVNRTGSNTINGYISGWKTDKTINSSTVDRELSIAISTMQ